MGRKIVSGFGGKMARIFMGGAEFCAEDWDITETGDEVDTTNTCGAGAEETAVTTTRLEGTINYTWDAEDNPWASIPNFNVGQEVVAVMYVHATSGTGNEDGPNFSFTMRILTHANSFPVKGKVTGTVSFKSIGSYSTPSDEISSGS